MKKQEVINKTVVEFRRLKVEIEGLQALRYDDEMQIKHITGEVDRLRKESAIHQARKDTLEEWLSELRDSFTQGKTVSANQLVIEINELLNWPE